MNKNRDSKWFHFTGIAGVATGQLAVELKRQAHIVTGSDRGLFPPMSDHLENNGINIELGYKYTHLTAEYYKQKYGENFNLNGKLVPDVLVMQGAKGEKNEEYTFAKKQGVSIKYYPEIVAENVINPSESIVVAGTYGKTTITSMLAWILENACFEPSFMFGGISLNFPNGVRFKTERTKFSVIEGDEYIVSCENPTSKFFLYRPKYLILTSCQWDHSDIFKTKDAYIKNFEKLVNLVGEDGVIFYSADDENAVELVKSAKCKTIGYKNSLTALNNDPSVNIDSGGFGLQILGDYNYANAQAAYEMAKFLGIEEKTIVKALESYKGIKRRLELKYKDEKLVVIDDFGASTSKAQAAIRAVKTQFSDYKIIGVFEPNLGSRTQEGLSEYNKTFQLLDELFLPRFTQVSGAYLTNQELADFLLKQNIKVVVENNDEQLIEKIRSRVSNLCPTLVIFLGSHGFRGLISSLVENKK
jgi:UDP-N-acetylmuramate: L-alanyl-gamma-D-glutamyl-meso-diaminopimelate ligase